MIQIGINIAVKGAGVSNLPPVNSSLPVVSGTTTLGSVLTTTNGTWTNSPTSFAYQWKRGATNIGTNTNTYTLVLTDSTEDITCVVTATNAVGSTPATSNTITADNYTPVCVLAPVISGSTSVGSLLTVTDNGDWDNSPTSFSYQWKRGATNIGTNTNSYTLVLADSGAAITCVVTGTNAIGSANATSNIITADNYTPVNTVAPVISGPTSVGSVLSTTNGTWTNSPSFSYQWKRGATNIGTNASTYTLVVADTNQAITCVVTGTNPVGSANATSNTITVDNPFISTFRTTASSETVTLPYEAAGTYSGTINWGDGGATSVNSYANRAHVYATAGDYVITVTGVTTGFRFNNGGDKIKIRSIQNWGTLKFQNNGANFYGCTNLTLTSVNGILDLTGITTMQQMFRQCSSLTTVNNINSWNTSAITGMSNCFSEGTFNSNISSWNTGAVVSMSNMFANNGAFNQNIGSWNTGAATNMSLMFYGASSFNQPIGSWNTGAVTNMSQMFESNSGFNQNIGSWNVANVTNFTNFMSGKTPATFSTTNLNAIYNGWSASGVKPNIVISFGGAKFTNAGGLAGKTLLLAAPNNWTITDGGGI